jgi:formate hydrogenlyase subunit 3/multisubunit Na+/H+ antiporter MnhD subunit
VYAIGHARHHGGLPGGGVLYLLFILAMLAVVGAGDGFTFLLAWRPCRSRPSRWS